MINKKSKRKKAFIGAVIGAVAAIGSAVAGSVISKNNAEKQAEEQQRLQNKNDTYTMAQNLTAGYGNQDYVRDFKNRVKFKKGGIMNNKYNDRIGRIKKFKCGGRKKAAWGANDTEAVISGLGSGISNIASSAITNSADTTVSRGNMFSNEPKTTIETPDYMTSTNMMRPTYLRCGGKRSKAKCGGKRKK